MPPSAFQNRKVGHDMRVTPAIHAAVMRRPVTQRPRKTAFGPWRSKNGSPTAITRRRWCRNGPGAISSRRPSLRPIAKPTLSPRIAARGRDGDDGLDRQVPAAGEDAGGDQRGLARDRDAHRLDRDEQEDDRKADVLGDVDEGREGRDHHPLLACPRCPP